MITSLPRTPTPAESKSPNSILLFGPPKVGKTVELAKLVGNLLLSLDPKGAAHVSCMKQQINNISEYIQVRDLLVKDSSPYKAISIDTTSSLEEFCEELATRQYKNFSPKFTGGSVTEVPEGYGYKWIRNAFYKMVDPLFYLKPKIIFTCHVRNKFIPETVAERLKSDVETEKELDLTAGIQRYLTAKVDCIGKLYRGSKDELRVKFLDGKTNVCGSRYEHLIGQDFEFDWKKIFPEMETVV